MRVSRSVRRKETDLRGALPPRRYTIGRKHAYGFSLIELMLAMTILGLGLVLVATMFPVAWTRARDLAEFTTQENITKSAHVLMQQIAQVDDDNPDQNINRGTFAGDIIYFPGEPGNTLFYIEANPRVHALHMENVTADSSAEPRRIIPNREKPLLDDEYAAWVLEKVDNPNQQTSTNIPSPFFSGGAFGNAQVRFEQRLYPPLPRRTLNTIDDEGEFIDTDEAWENALDERRFAWAVLHRMRRDPMIFEEWFVDRANADKNQELAQEPREFDMYYVTLRRSRPNSRFAVQDPDAAPDPFAAEVGTTPRRGSAVTPAALPANKDVILPVPWRVQVWFPGDVAPATNPTGVPTEIEINTENAGTDAPFLVGMFDVGTQFVDEANGKIYRVARRRIIGDGADQSLVTLDQEVAFEDINDGFYSQTAGNEFGNNIIDPAEQLRTVWVFPPPAEAERTSDGDPIFTGKQPVVAIDVRILTVEP